MTWMKKQKLHGSFESSTHSELENMGLSLYVVFPIAFICGE